GTISHGNLHNVGFGNLAKSVCPCEMVRVEKAESSVFVSITHFDSCSCCIYSIICISVNGKIHEISSDSCANIPESFLALDEGVSGVWSKGTCVILYEVSLIHHNPLKLCSSTLGHENLQPLGFDNRAQSIGPCDIKRVEIEPAIRNNGYVSYHSRIHQNSTSFSYTSLSLSAL
ncbi:hypothetical protein PENTCL1PPCAC_537, partial [Pristionchus entomophagus]